MDSEAFSAYIVSDNRTDVLLSVRNTIADSFGMKTVLFTHASSYIFVALVLKAGNDILMIRLSTH